jgi:CheY-like chemotaxis protein
MAQALTLSGFGVVQACDGRQAVDKARMNPPDVVVMDIWLPGIDGFAVARVLKTYAPTSHIPIVAFTGDPRLVESGSGFDAVLAKPATPEALARGISLLLSVHASDLRSSR